MGQYFTNVAYVMDVLVNVLCGDMFNDLFRREFGYDFGGINDSISRALGMNKIWHTDTWLGRGVSRFLNWLDKDHVEKAAK